LGVPKARLYITHRSDDEGLAYWHWLKREAQVMGVQVQLIDHLIGNDRAKLKDHKVYSLWDAYPHADLVTFPSLYEGFGNALLETVYFKRLTVVNRYPVYNADIRPLGFKFIEMDGFVDENTILETKRLLQNPDQVREMAETNYTIAREHFSYQVLEDRLEGLLANCS
jgi:mannosylglucosylglycerate synthase